MFKIDFWKLDGSRLDEFWNEIWKFLELFEDERLEGKFSGKKLCSPWRNGGTFQTLHLPMITIRWMERITFSKHRRLFEFPTSVLCFSTETNPRTRFFLARTICLESKIKSDMLSSEQFNDIDPTAIYYKLFIALNTHVNKKGVQTKQEYATKMED